LSEIILEEWDIVEIYGRNKRIDRLSKFLFKSEKNREKFWYIVALLRKGFPKLEAMTRGELMFREEKRRR
jgi:hypothetical protein